MTRFAEQPSPPRVNFRPARAARPAGQARLKNTTKDPLHLAKKPASAKRKNQDSHASESASVLKRLASSSF